MYMYIYVPAVEGQLVSNSNSESFCTMHKTDTSRDQKIPRRPPQAQRKTKNETTDSGDAFSHPLPQVSDGRLLVARRRSCSSANFSPACVELQTLLVLREFFHYLVGQFLRRSAGFGLLSALGNGHVTGASSAVVASLQPLITTDLTASRRGGHLEKKKQRKEKKICTYWCVLLGRRVSVQMWRLRPPSVRQ